LPWIEQLLIDLEAGRCEPGDLDLIAHNAQLIGTPGNTFCLHATGAIEPLASAMKYFRDEFEAHIRERGCPHRKAAVSRGS
jgi:NADH-quinone oxidoreductase subunit F